MTFEEIKIGFSYIAGMAWIFVSDFVSWAIINIFMFIGVSTGMVAKEIEHEIDFWVKIIVYVIGAIFIWAYSIRKIRHTKAIEIKELAEAEKIKQETDAIKLENQIGRETFNTLSLQELIYRQEKIKSELGKEKYEQYVAEIKKQMEGKV